MTELSVRTEDCTFVLLQLDQGGASASRDLRASQKSKQPDKRFLRMRGKAPDLASDMGNLMEIHQGKDQGIEHSKHLSQRGNADATSVFPKGHVATPVEAMFDRPMIADHLEKPLDRTLLPTQGGQARDHFHAALLLRLALALQTKDLPDFPPFPVQILVEIRSGQQLTPLQATMTFLHVFVRLPGAPIRLRIFNKQFQSRSCSRGMLFHDENDIAAGTLHQSPKLVIALRRIGGQNASLTHHLGQQRFERTDLVLLLRNWALMQNTPGLPFIDMQDMLLWLLASIHLLACSFEHFPVNRHMDCPAFRLRRSATGFGSASAFRLFAHQPIPKLLIDLLAIEPSQGVCVRIGARHLLPREGEVLAQVLCLISTLIACSQQALHTCQLG